MKLRDWPSLVKSPVIVLAGAAHGQKVEYYRKRWPKARYLLFEPNPAYHGQLARFDGDPLVTITHGALADWRGMSPFYQNEQPQTSGLYPANLDNGWGERIGGGREIFVRCETLDAFCQESGIDRIGFIELDCQGGELAALRGAEGLLSRRAIDCLMVELFYSEVYRGIPMAVEVHGYLNGLGYKCAGTLPRQHDSPWGDGIYYAKGAK